MSSVEDNRKSSKQFRFQQKKQMTTMMRRKRETIQKLSPAIDEMENLGTELLIFNSFRKTQKNKISVPQKYSLCCI